MKRLRVFLAEDQTILRHSLKALITNEPDLEVVGEAGDGVETIQLVETLRPEIVVMDISMPQMDGIQATLAVKRVCPEVKVLALTVHETRSHIRRVLKAGASGYVVKRSAAEELIQALRAVAADGVYLDPIVAAKLVGVSKPPFHPKTEGEMLSDRELKVLRLIALGYVNKEIAAQLNLSIKTVETFKARSLEKLRLRSRVDIVHYAMERGWLISPGNGLRLGPACWTSTGASSENGSCFLHRRFWGSLSFGRRVFPDNGYFLTYSDATNLT